MVIPNGRIDVTTDDYVIEIDKIAKWAECLGQALFYSSTTGKRGICALIVDNPDTAKEKLKVIENLFNQYDIALIVLVKK